MKLRLLPVVLSVLVSASLLFGGYFAYQSYAMESPLEKVVSAIPGVELEAIKLSGSEAELELKVAPGTSLREVYRNIQNEGRSTLGSRELKLKVVNEPSERLEQWWSSALFEVAQAMETKQYAQIPKTLEERSAKSEGVKAASEMDDKFVYITITDGNNSKYVILPRTPAKLGVWTNE
ncbi:MULTISPECIES: hypothetical protein [unclassified Paenibacillus]|uniref:hypothetical protein n=1 Tax=unclassified Paenibacillus TaxID=185978 RepID=UPI001AE477CC|nr:MULTISPECIES: hypothetical protein [unclassified Paenibacillus]MBP1155309.1 hypothetical protein [Paenibacillus sp. PvP091]MBP1169307.1 hypothetical protein [Paenibacillus sp. PvR098]MBP2440335.1 hypothetical protein [Paenibacillus sp. PvP052]